MLVVDSLSSLTRLLPLINPFTFSLLVNCVVLRP